jgi:hypothetical protein
MDYRDILIIFYFNSVKSNYIYSDLVELLGLTYSLVSEKVDTLIEEAYLFLDEDKLIQISEKGLVILREKKFSNIHIFDLYDDKGLANDKISKCLDVNEIFIPKNFDKKFKGY